MIIKKLTLVVFLLNLPFGCMRGRSVVFSKRWLLAVHLPVPFVFILRRACGLGWHTVPYLVLASVAGQLLGGKLGQFVSSNRAPAA